MTNLFFLSFLSQPHHEYTILNNLQGRPLQTKGYPLWHTTLNTPQSCLLQNEITINSRQSSAFPRAAHSKMGAIDTTCD